MQTSKLKRQNCSHITKGRKNFSTTRVISSNICVNGVSGNWRPDYHKFKGHSYAHVLKSAGTVASLAPQQLSLVSSNVNSAMADLSSSCVKNVIVKDKPKCSLKKHCHLDARDRVSTSGETSKIINATNVTHPKVSKKTCSLDEVLSGHTEVGASGVPTRNRYEVLDLDDGVILRHSDIASSNSQAICSTGGSGKLEDSSANINDPQGILASHCDARDKTNTSAFQKVDPPNQAPSTSAIDTEMQATSKYDLPLRLKDKKIDYTKIMPSCPTLQRWDNQTVHKFGFIPMGELDVPP